VHELLAWPRRVTEAAVEAVRTFTGLDAARPAPRLMPTPRGTVFTDGTASLYRFARPRGADTSAANGGAPVKTPILLIPSLINRWYVMDLRPGASLVEALVAAGFDVWLLDWGVPEDEDRHRTWTDVLDRLDRMIRVVLRRTKQPKLAVLGYCMGGTLTAIDAALRPSRIAAFMTLAAPIDFVKGGMLRCMVDTRWFDGEAIADAGNVAPMQMQAGFTALRPTLDLAKVFGQLDLVGNPAAQESFAALEAWASDNIPFPGEAYRTYITELYQGNGLVERTHRVRDQLVDLRAITAPTLAIVAERDAICPPAAATALLDHVGTKDVSTLKVPGGHVGAVVGSRASKDMYPALIAWLRARIS
jgi:polyhydroxyalkanoate synthase